MVEPREPHEKVGVTVELLLGSRAGNRGDLEELCLRVGPVVKTWAHAHIPRDSRGRIHPDDVTQEAWLRVLAKIGSLKTVPDNFRGWVIAIARNVIFELARKDGGRDGRSDPWETHIREDPDPATGISVRVARQDALSAFLERVDRLGEVERQLLVLHGLEGRNFLEIGERLELSRDVCAKRWQRLRARLEADGLPEFLLED